MSCSRPWQWQQPSSWQLSSCRRRLFGSLRTKNDPYRLRGRIVTTDRTGREWQIWPKSDRAQARGSIHDLTFHVEHPVSSIGRLSVVGVSHETATLFQGIEHKPAQKLGIEVGALGRHP